MIWGGSTGWQLAGFGVHMLAALACAGLALWVASRSDPARPDRSATLAALILTACWAVTNSALGPDSAISILLESVRDIAWLHLLYRLFEVDGRHTSLKPIKPLIGALAFVEGLQLVLPLVQWQFAGDQMVAALASEIRSMFNMLVAIGALVLLHNLYAGAGAAARTLLRWSATGLAMLWIYDLNLYTVAYLGGSVVQLRALQGLAVLSVAGGIAMGLSPARARTGLKPSRAVAFQSLSLLVIGAYLALMLVVAQWINVLGGDFGRLAQVGVLFFGSLAALYWLPSQRLRALVRVTVLKNFFQHRYDYRAEWLRFNQTVGRSSETSLSQRVVQALADITESPSGILLLPDEAGAVRLAARWHGAADDVPNEPLNPELAAIMARRGYIVELDAVREGTDRYGEAAFIDRWLLDDASHWALVPLIHFDRLTGVVVLGRPAESRALDWEDLDLLKVASQQLASYLAEQHNQQALMDAARFDEFNRRMAFVMHDIKNLTSQLSLLARNAEKHAENPAFRADMLVTLRNSSDKLTTLLARLGRYGAGTGDGRKPIAVHDLVHALAQRFSVSHPVAAVIHTPCTALAAADNLDQALCHLVQNAVDASPAGSPVFIEVACDDGSATIQVIDAGEGMSAEFVRSGLFKPFVSSKNGGFGIGAFEARELVRSMGGSLDVDSREGLGTRFVIRLPLATAGMIDLPQGAAA